MNRLALLTMTAFLTVGLSACGDRPEKKVETQAEIKVEQSAPAEPAKAPAAAEPVTPDAEKSQAAPTTTPDDETAKPQGTEKPAE